MVEDCIVRGLISQDCGTVHRLVETDTSHQGLAEHLRFNIIYIMRTHGFHRGGASADHLARSEAPATTASIRYVSDSFRKTKPACSLGYSLIRRARLLALSINTRR